MRHKQFVTMRVALPGSKTLYDSLGVDERGRVQRHVTESVFKRIYAYIPMKSGELRASARIIGPTRIRVETPYARAQFFGVTKEGKPFDYMPTGPKVGSHWDRRLKADEGRAIIAEASRYASRTRG